MRVKAWLYIILLPLLLLSQLCHAQQIDPERIDSIRNELDRASNPDSTKISLWIELGGEYYKIKTDSLLIIGHKLLELSETSGSQRAKAYGYEYLSNHYFNSNLYDSSIFYNQLAYNIATKHLSKREQANLLFAMANTYNVKGNHDLAVEKYYESLKIFESIDDVQSLSPIYNNLGLLFQDRKEFEKALSLYRKSWTIDTVVGDKLQIATTLNNIGGVYQDMQRYDSAIVYFKNAMELYKEINYTIGLAHGYNNIGIIYYYQGEPKKCMEYFKKSLEMRIAIGNKVNISQSYNNIGILYMYQEDYKQAEEYSLKALEIAREADVKVETMDALINLYEIYYSDGQYKKAADMLQEHSNLRDSVYAENQQKIITEMETKYDTEKKEQQIKLQNAQIETQRLQKYFYIAAGVLTFIILLITAYSLIQKKKDNQLLREQKNEIAEKNEELNQQNEEIIAISEKLEEQYGILNKQNNDILSSISYAKKIQEAILPPPDKLQHALPQSFVIYLPKDIVSGDFYWMEIVDNKVLWAVVDCTGHGVPGAFMSIVGSNGLKKIVLDQKITNPAEILTKLTDHVVSSMVRGKEDAEIMDGMDIALCCWDRDTNTLEFAGAYNPLYLIRNGELQEFKGTKRPIGRFVSKKSKEFTTETLSLQPGDLVYTFSDGYADQFGGPSGSKYTYRRFKEKLLEVSDKPLPKQKTLLLDGLESWMENEKQLDDICVFAVKV